jgi:uncharacterized protein YhjY with autotransporter beta-barrel domain
LGAILQTPAQAAVFSDPIGDFIPSYTGPKNSDLDVRTTEAVYDGVNITVKINAAGAIGQTPGANYVWGFQRGQGTPRFGAIAPGVLFDSVVTFAPGGVAAVRDLVTGLGGNLPASAVTVSGNDISVTFPAAMLPSAGLTPGQFLFNLWPRSPGAATSTIADFAPDNSDTRLTLAFPLPAVAAAQSDVAIDDASFTFERLASRLSAQRSDGAPRGGAFVVVGGRAGDDGLSGSAITRSRVGEITAGLDFALTPNLVVGVAASKSSGNYDLPLNGELKSDSGSGYVFGGFSQGGFHLDAFGGYTSLDFSSKRAIPIGSSVFYGSGQPKGWDTSFGGRAGYDMPMGSLTWGPVVDVVHTHVKLKSYGETGAGPFNDFGAIVGGRTRDSTRLGLGVQVDHRTAADWGVLQAHLTARVVQELGDARDAFSFAFVPQPDVVMNLTAPKVTKTYGAFDIGLDARFKSGVILGLTFSPRIDKGGIVDNAAFLTARFGF